MKRVAAADDDGLRFPDRTFGIAGFVKRTHFIPHIGEAEANSRREGIIRGDHASEGDKQGGSNLATEQVSDLIFSVC